MINRDDIKRLAAEVEKLTSPYDAEINAAIGVALGLPTVDRTGQPGYYGWYFVNPLPNYTGDNGVAEQLLTDIADKTDTAWSLDYLPGRTDDHWYVRLDSVSGTNRNRSRYARHALLAGALRLIGLPGSP